MLTLQQIKSNPAEVVARLAVKGFDGKEAIDRVLALDDRRRQLQLDNDNKAAELNRLSASIGALMKQGKRDEAEQAKQEVALLKESQRGIAQQLAETEQEQHDLLITIPNMPCAMVPAGTSAADNVVEKTGGPMPELGEDALPHWELAKKYNLIDFDLGVKITGAGFPVYMGKGRGCNVRSYNFSLTGPMMQAIWKSNPLMLSTRLLPMAPGSCLTKRGRCITASSTTSTLSPPQKCL